MSEKQYPQIMTITKIDDNVRQKLMDILGDEDELNNILKVLPNIDFSKFLLFYGKFIERQENDGKFSQKKLMENYIEVVLLFPYFEELGEWFRSSIPNEMIPVYRGYGCTSQEAEALYRDSITDSDDLDKYYLKKISMEASNVPTDQ